MSRNRLAFADRDPVELRGDTNRPTRSEATGPADGCSGMPWCECHTCERVNPPAARDAADAEDFGMGEW